MRRRHVAWKTFYLLESVVVALVIMALMPFSQFSSRVIAQNARAITFDTPVIGQITDTNPTDTWQLTTLGKDVFSIQVRRADGTLVPKVELHDGQGKLIASADHDATASNAEIPSLQVSGAGTYTILVGRYQDQNGKTSGTYGLLVMLLGAGPDRPGPNGPLQSGGEVRDYPFKTSGILTAAHWGRIYVLPSNFLGARIGIEVTRDVTVPLFPGDVSSPSERTPGAPTTVLPDLTNNLIPTISVLALDLSATPPANSSLLQATKIVQQATVGADGATATLDMTVPDTQALYLILIARRDNEKGVTIGRFNLTMSFLGSSEATLRNNIGDGEIKLGTSQTRSVNNDAWMNRLVLTLNNVAPITIAVKRKYGTLVPAIKVLDKTGKEFASATHDDSFAAATISKFVPPAPGQYEIDVFRDGGQAGVTEGVYEIRVILIP